MSTKQSKIVKIFHLTPLAQSDGHGRVERGRVERSQRRSIVRVPGHHDALQPGHILTKIFSLLELQLKVREELKNAQPRKGPLLEPQFQVYLPCLGSCLAWCLNSVLNVKALVGAFSLGPKSSRGLLYDCEIVTNLRYEL